MSTGNIPTQQSEKNAPSQGGAALLDVAQVAELLGCSERHVYRMTDGGLMPAKTKLGSLVRWNRESIHDWIAGGCKPVRTTTRGR